MAAKKTPPLTEKEEMDFLSDIAYNQLVVAPSSSKEERIVLLQEIIMEYRKRKESK